MPTMLYDILNLLGAILRLVGVLVLGLGLGWFSLDAYRKENWQTQVTSLAAFVFAAVGLAKFLSPGALGMFALGAGGALLLWGKGKDKKEKEEE